MRKDEHEITNTQNGKYFLHLKNVLKYKMCTDAIVTMYAFRFIQCREKSGKRTFGFWRKMENETALKKE